MGTTKIEAPSQPQAPSVSSSISDYVNSYPRLVQLESQYGPQLAAQDYSLAQQYAPQYAQLLKQVNQETYPETSGLQENMAKIASQNMSGDLPESLKKQYLDQFRSEVGSPGSGISADYVSRNMINAAEDYKRYYQSLALSLAGRQPLVSSQVPNFKSTNSLMSPESALGFNQGVYGSQAGMYNSLLSSNTALAQSGTQGMYGLLGAGLQTAGLMYAAPFMGKR